MCGILTVCFLYREDVAQTPMTFYRWWRDGNLPYSSIYDHACVYMRIADGYWENTQCHTGREISFVCSVSSASTPWSTNPAPTIAPTAASVCSTGYTVDDVLQCYKYVRTAASWTNAKAACAADGATLLTIPDGVVNDYVATKFESSSVISNYLWLGLRYNGLGDAQWRW